MAMNKSGRNSASSRNDMPAQRSTTTETTTTEIITRPGSSSSRKSKDPEKNKWKRKETKQNGSKRAWELRPHETKFALPGPGNAVNTNDETWYIGKLRDQADRYGAVPWTAIAGDNLTGVDYIGVINQGDVSTQMVLHPISRNFPSVMVAGLIPSLGNTTTIPTRLDMPWMTTAEQKIAYLQSKISGSLPFHAADLVCYWFAAADIFAEIAQAERALKIARTWLTYENISYPKQLCAAVGWDFDSIMGNVRVFEGQIQEVINLANTLLLPKDLSLVERWYFLYSHVFKDSNLPTAKLYAYRKDGYYTFEEQLYDTGTALEFHRAPCCQNDYPSSAVVGYWTPTTWFSGVMGRISKLLPGRSTAVVDIMAKLLRAYDVSTFFAYPNVSSEGLTPKFDPEALTAFANMSLTGALFYNIKADTLEHLNFKQNVNSLTLTYAAPIFQPGLYIPVSNILRAWEAKPSVGSLFEMTRLVCCEDGNTSQSAGFMYTGTEIVNAVAIYTGSGETADERKCITSRVRTLFGVDVTEDASLNNRWRSAFETSMLWVKFEYAPLTGLNLRRGDDLAGNNVSLVADMDNYAVLKSDVLKRIHRLAIANLWGVQTDFIG